MRSGQVIKSRPLVIAAISASLMMSFTAAPEIFGDIKAKRCTWSELMSLRTLSRYPWKVRTRPSSWG